MKGSIEKNKKISTRKKASKQHLNSFIKTLMYAFLFIIIPALLLGLCLNFFVF